MVRAFNRILKNILLITGLGVLWYFTACETETPSEPENNSISSATMLAQLTSSHDRIGPGGSARISAVVIDENANPLPGKLVTFSVGAGTITPFDTTSRFGVAEAIFIAPQAVGPVKIDANLGGQNDSLMITVDGQISQNLHLSADITNALANGFHKIKLRITLSNAEQAPRANTIVNLSATAGSLPQSVITDASGLASAVLVAPASTTDVLSTIRAFTENIEAFTQISFRGIRLSLNSQTNQLLADGRSQAKIRAHLKETSTHIAVPGAPITFGTTHGTIANSVNTDASGVAEVLLTSSTDTGTATIIARYGEAFSDTVMIAFGASTPTYMTLSATPSVLLADSESESEIKAVITDASNNPVADGTPVQFQILSGSGTIETRKATKVGVAASRLISSNHPDSVFIRAETGGLADTVLVRFIVGKAANITLLADSASLPADGITSTAVRAFVYDKAGNPVQDGTVVHYSADFGDITPVAETQFGLALASYSSDSTGLARISVTSDTVSASTTIRLLPGPPNSILISYNPVSLGVKDSGRNTTLTITADVRDAKNNPVRDGTHVAFSIVAAPGGGEILSSELPVPTLNGSSQVSLNAGIRSGAVRIQATVVDASGNQVLPPVSAVSTDVIIVAGPPYIANVNDPSTSRVSVGANPVNIFGWHVVNDTTSIVAIVGDKFNNPVPEGTAVYFTTTGGIVTTYTGYTNTQGIAVVSLHSAQPYPTVPLYYNTFLDPNVSHPAFTGSPVIPGPIPDFEGGAILNGYDDTSQNNGIARVLAVTEGIDANGNPARVWGIANVVFSGQIATFNAMVSDTELLPGEGTSIDITIYDGNGNPIVPGSTITLEAGAGKLSWSELTTSDPGTTTYRASLVNDLDPNDPDAQQTAVSVGIRVQSKNGSDVISTTPILLKLQ
ncbi:MAG: Ig-like domain-containing protein [bacterium]